MFGSLFGRRNKEEPEPGRRAKADHVEFERIAMPHADALYGAALRMARDASQAEDLVQETLLRAYRFWHKFEPGTNVKAWLFRIQTNIFINRYRKTQTEQQIIDDREAEDLLNRYAAEESTFIPPDTREEFFRSVLPDEVMAALDALPFDFRMAVLLADLHELSYKEIAEVLDCPVGTVMSRLHRARKLLQAQLIDYATARGIVTRRGPAGEQQTDNVADLSEFRRRKAAGA